MLDLARLAEKVFLRQFDFVTLKSGRATVTIK